MAMARPRVVILGTGWAGNKVARRLDKSKFDVRIISPANHFLFTSLLPSTTTGTVEFRAIQEPVRTIKGLGQYYQAKARTIDFAKRVVKCEDVFRGQKQFDVKYDALIIAPGSKTSDFGVPGVSEMERRPDGPLFYLKHLYHARAIRNRILECFERSVNPTLTPAEKSRLLSFVVVGGGPTSCEFAAELSEFITEDVARWFPDVAPLAQVTLLEAGPRVLGSFDTALVEYYDSQLRKKGIVVRTGTAVTEVAEIPLYLPSAYWSVESITITVAKLADHTELPFGCLVWSAGLAPVKLVSNLPASLARGPGGRLAVDPYLRVPGTHGRVFALGDCAATTLDGGDDATAIGALPPTASVAEQQAQYLADCFNETYANSSKELSAKPSQEELAVGGFELPVPAPVYPGVMPFDFPPFTWLNRLYAPSSTFHYVNRGAMASLGSRQGVADLTNTGLKGAPHIAIGTGAFSSAAALAIWRGTYTFKQLSWSNTLLIPMYWLKTWVFGRDISRF